MSREHERRLHLRRGVDAHAEVGLVAEHHRRFLAAAHQRQARLLLDDLARAERDRLHEAGDAGRLHAGLGRAGRRRSRRPCGARGCRSRGRACRRRPGTRRGRTSARRRSAAGAGVGSGGRGGCAGGRRARSRSERPRRRPTAASMRTLMAWLSARASCRGAWLASARGPRGRARAAGRGRSRPGSRATRRGCGCRRSACCRTR